MTTKGRVATIVCVAFAAGTFGGAIATKTAMAAGHYPEMDKALRALTNASNFLSTANRDFHGHRAKALDLTNKALEEVQKGIAEG